LEVWHGTQKKQLHQVKKNWTEKKEGKIDSVFFYRLFKLNIVHWTSKDYYAKNKFLKLDCIKDKWSLMNMQVQHSIYVTLKYLALSLSCFIPSCGFLCDTIQQFISFKIFWYQSSSYTCHHVYIYLCSFVMICSYMKLHIASYDKGLSTLSKGSAIPCKWLTHSSLDKQKTN